METNSDSKNTVINYSDMKSNNNTISSDKTQDKKKRLIVVSSILGIIVIGFIIYLSYPYIFGETVLLRTQPIDPFDIFRGQYINIRYEITTIQNDASASIGDTVYVLLQKESNTKFWIYKGVSITQPENDIFIKGSVKSISGNSINIEYGIEQYFFERNAEFSIQNLSVEAKIDGFGNSRIKQLMNNEKPIEIKYKEIEVTS